MLNATTKTIIAALVLSVGAAACTDKEKEGATALYNESASAIEARDFSGALTLLDTLNSRYSSQTAIRRDALRLRARAIEGLVTDSIADVSRSLAESTLAVEHWSPLFRHISSSVGLDGYYIPVKASEKVMTATGIQPRVSEKGLFYIVANVQGRAIGLQSIDFVDGSESVSSSAISPARVVKVEGSESASFNPEDLEGIGQWLIGHPSASKVILRGSKGNVTVKIDKALMSQLTDCYQYAEALQAQRLASIKREKYERMLATARDQLANLPNPEEEKK